MNHISVNLTIDGRTVLAVQTAATATPRGERLLRAYDAFRAAIEAVTEPDGEAPGGDLAARQERTATSDQP